MLLKKVLSAVKYGKLEKNIKKGRKEKWKIV